MPDIRSLADEYRGSLPAPDPVWGGTGCLFRDPDPRDYHLELMPKVADALATALPASFSVVPSDLTEAGLSQAIGVVYDQDGEGACVAFSTGNAKSIEDFLDEKRWRLYDAETLYRACGGTGEDGIFADSALRYTRDIGLTELATGVVRRISSYAFAPQVRDAWRQTLAAALVSSGPCVVALLLPTQLGWNCNEIASAGYHQMCLVAYTGLGDTDFAVLLNSWGRAYRLVRVTWRFLEGNSFQSRHVYGYQLQDIRDWVEPDPDPTPDPNHYSFAARIAVLKEGKIVLVTEVASPNLRGRRVNVNAGALQFPAKIKAVDGEVVILKGSFDTRWMLKDAMVQVETVEP